MDKVMLAAPLKTTRRNVKWRTFCAQLQLQSMGLLGVIWMLIFFFAPMVGLVLAFKNYSISSTILEAPWAGLEHFTTFFQDEKFWPVIKNTLGISVLKLVLSTPAAIFFALFLNELRTLRFKKLVQTVSYLPHFLSWVIVGGIMMNWMAETGIFNQLLMAMGIIEKPILFLAEPNYFWWIVVLSDLWKELGWNSIIYIAAISAIDQSYYEAADVDGAGRFQKMWRITLPCIAPTIATLFLLNVGYLMNSNFDQILVLSNQLNASASDVIDVYIYRMGITNSRFSYSTAVGLVKSVISLLLLIGANQVTKRLSDTQVL